MSLLGTLFCRHRTSTTLMVLSSMIALIVMASCKPTTGLSSKSPSAEKQNESANASRSSKTTEVNGADDTLFDEETTAVPPEVITGHYLTCEVKAGSGLDSGVTLGCTGHSDGKRNSPQAEKTKWYAAKDLLGTQDVVLQPNTAAGGEFDAVFTIARDVLASAKFIKAEQSSPSGVIIYSTPVSRISDFVTSVRASSLADESINDAGFQILGSGKLVFSYKQGTIKVVPSPKIGMNTGLTGASVRLIFSTALTTKKVNHDFGWVETSMDNKGSIMPGSVSKKWRLLTPVSTGALPVKILSFSSCTRCGAKPYPASSPKPNISASISDTEFTLSYSLNPNEIFGVAVDIPVEAR